jgi:hypothetical protein
MFFIDRGALFVTGDVPSYALCVSLVWAITWFLAVRIVAKDGANFNRVVSLASQIITIYVVASAMKV